MDEGPVEAAVERFWLTLRIPTQIKELIQVGLCTELDSQHERAASEIGRARACVEQLAEGRRRLARGVVNQFIPITLSREEHDHILSDLSTRLGAFLTRWW